MIVFWGLIIAGAIALVRYFTSRSDRGESGVSSRGRGPEQILAERFARGEIDEDEYRQRREALRAGR
jgi:putative membrane protein